MDPKDVIPYDPNRDCGCPASPSTYEPGAKRINLAIQGGGAHGAYSWGTLDRLPEDGRLEVEGLCGTSAGSMNAVVFAYGNMLGGRGGAREALYHFWKKISDAGALYSPLRHTPWEYFNTHVLENWNMDHSLSYRMFDTVTGLLSPYQFNPFNFNPLRQVLEAAVDFNRLRQPGPADPSHQPPGAGRTAGDFGRHHQPVE